LSLVQATAGILAGIRDKIIDPRDIPSFCFRLPLDVGNFVRSNKVVVKQGNVVPKQEIDGKGKTQPIKASVSGFRKFLTSKGFSEVDLDSIKKYDSVKIWLSEHPNEARSYANEAGLLVKKAGKIDKDLITATLVKVGLSPDEVKSSTGWYPTFSVAQSASDKAATPESDNPDPGKSDEAKSKPEAKNRKDSEPQAKTQIHEIQDPHEELIFGNTEDELLNVGQVMAGKDYVKADYSTYASDYAGVFQGKTEPEVRESLGLSIAYDKINDGTKVQKMAIIRGAFAGLAKSTLAGGSTLKHVNQQYEMYDETVNGETMNPEQLKVFQNSLTLMVRTHNALKQSIIRAGIEPNKENWKLLMQEDSFISVIGSVCEKLAKDPDFFGSAKSSWKNLPGIPNISKWIQATYSPKGPAELISMVKPSYEC